MKNNIRMREIDARNLDILVNILLEFNKNNSSLFNVQIYKWGNQKITVQQASGGFLNPLRFIQPYFSSWSHVNTQAD